MSLVHKEEIICPKCKTHGEFDIWETMNVDLNPELREKLFSEDAFFYRCPKCGMEIAVPYDFIYHDMKHKFIIMFSFFEPDEFDYEPLEIPHLSESLKDYTFRHAIGLFELKEKIHILEKGLNDVAIERMKYAMSHYECPQFAEKGIKLYFSDVRYDLPEYPLGSILFTVNTKDTETKIYAFPLNLYQHQCLACEIDPRMRVTGAEKVDDGWMSMKLGGDLKGKLQQETPEETCHGFYIIKKTIRKSKNNPKTRYVEGIAHTNGDVLFPMIFEHIRWFGENEAALADLGNKTYILTIRGGIFDPIKYKEEQQQLEKNTKNK